MASHFNAMNIGLERILGPRGAQWPGQSGDQTLRKHVSFHKLFLNGLNCNPRILCRLADSQRPTVGNLGQSLIYIIVKILEASRYNSGIATRLYQKLCV